MFTRTKAYQRFLFLLIVVILLMMAAAAVGQPAPVAPQRSSPTWFSQASRAESQRQQAARLTAQGHEQFNSGQPEAALHSWQQARQLYQHLDYAEGIAGSRINHSLALLALGHDRQACSEVLSVLPLTRISARCRLQDYRQRLTDREQTALAQELARLDPSPLTALGLRVAGEALRKLGEVEIAQQLATQGLAIAQLLGDPAEIVRHYLSLGNIERLAYLAQQALAERRNHKQILELQPVITLAQNIANLYEQANQVELGAEALNLRSLIQVNYLDFLVEYGEWLQSHRLYPEFDQELRRVQDRQRAIVTTLLSTPNPWTNLPTIEAIHARLHLAKSLLQLPELGPDLPATAQQLMTTALALARHLHHQRLQAIALGQLGYLYQVMGHLPQARQYTEQSIQLAQRLKAPELAFRTQHQLGQIHHQFGDRHAAIAAYTAAIVDLDQIRKEILYNSSDLLFPFKTDIEPIYRELIELYLERENQPSQDTLQAIIQINRKFQQVELENFLKCGLYSTGEQRFLEQEITKRLGNNLHADDVIIYLISLKSSHKILTIVNSSRYSEKLIAKVIDWQEVESNFNLIQNHLGAAKIDENNFSDRLQHALHQFYAALIQPIRPALPASGTLLFVIDGDLQGIPLALLQDENDRYLIEDYSIAYVPGSYIRPLVPLNPKRDQALLSGVSVGESFTRAGLDPLENITTEIQGIKAFVKTHTILLNQQFTVQALQDRLQHAPITILHLATHGQFSSDPAETRIWAYDQALSLEDLDRLLWERTQRHPTNLELLVLSACETAKGDRRGDLGLAGVAIRAGARSTLASLWQVNDQSTALFMKQFYRSLTLGKSRAAALREAQLALLHNPDHDPDWYPAYQNPYYWAAFILIGSWV